MIPDPTHISHPQPNMNAADIKDVMGDMPITAAAHHPPAKKHKAVEKRPGELAVMVPFAYPH